MKVSDAITLQKMLLCKFRKRNVLKTIFIRLTWIAVLGDRFHTWSSEKVRPAFERNYESVVGSQTIDGRFAMVIQQIPDVCE